MTDPASTSPGSNSRTPVLAKPTELAICLAAAQHKGGWLAADEIRGGLQVLGFEGLTAQWVASKLGKMCREPIPRFERERTMWGDWTYRVTIGGGATFLHNRGYGGLRLARGDTSSMTALLDSSATFHQPARRAES